MGASGSRWIKHKKHKGLRAAAITNAPHPTVIRQGQRYFPLESKALTTVTMRVLRVTGDRCELKREDHDARVVRVRTDRLLGVRPDGGGRHYRFVGYAPRTYATHVCVAEVDEHWVKLLCPEWHPEIPITVASGSLSEARRRVGEWLACRADLSAAAAARVGPRDFKAPQRGFDPSAYHPVDLPAAEEPAAPRSADDDGRRDVVLFIPASKVDDACAGSGVYLNGHPPPVERGGRAYIHADGALQGWRAVETSRPTPNGTRLLLSGAFHPVHADVAVRVPASGVAGGSHGLQLWDWRSWPREIEVERPA